MAGSRNASDPKEGGPLKVDARVSGMVKEPKTHRGDSKSSPITLAMSSIFGGRYGCYIPDWAVLVAAVVVFLMLLAIVILSICLCRVCKRVKKRRMSLNASENTCEADLHYAELQNLPAFSRGQCDGGANLDAQNSDYATVAVLKEDPSEEDFGNHQQIEDSGVEDGVRDDQIFVGAESASCDLE